MAAAAELGRAQAHISGKLEVGGDLANASRNVCQSRDGPPDMHMRPLGHILSALEGAALLHWRRSGTSRLGWPNALLRSATCEQGRTVTSPRRASQSGAGVP